MAVNFIQASIGSRGPIQDAHKRIIIPSIAPSRHGMNKSPHLEML